MLLGKKIGQPLLTHQLPWVAISTWVTILIQSARSHRREEKRSQSGKRLKEELSKWEIIMIIIYHFHTVILPED